jgi:HEAT repeat protein
LTPAPALRDKGRIMTARRPLSLLGLVLVAALCLPAPFGCGGGRNKPRPVRLNKLPKSPPAVPPQQNVAIDPALVAAARQEILSAALVNDPLIRAHAMEGLKDGLGAPAAEWIIRGLTDNDPVVRFAAALAAGELRLHQAKNALLVLSDDADPSVRVGAKFALHRIGDTRQSHDLELTAKDPVPRTRGDTALVLGLLGEPSAVKILMPMLFDNNPAVRLQAAEALWRLKSENGLQSLVSFSVSKFPDDQMIALLALAAPRDRRVLGHLEGELTSDYDEVSLVAARGAGLLGSDRGYGVALKGAKSADPRQRMLAAMAFGAISRTDAQPVLATLLKDADPDVRLAAATALLQLKGLPNQ